MGLFSRHPKPKHIRDLDYWDLRRLLTSATNHLVFAETDLNGIIGHLDTREDEEDRTGPGRDRLERWRREIQAIRFEMQGSPAQAVGESTGDPL